VGPGRLKKLCLFVSVEGDFLPILDPLIGTLQCRPWQIGPVFTSSDFVTMFFIRGGVVTLLPTPSNPGGPMFSVGVVSLS